jgi:hypothetical protein
MAIAPHVETSATERYNFEATGVHDARRKY